MSKEESKNDVVKEAREHVAGGIPVCGVCQRLLTALCDELEQLRSLNQTQAESIVEFQSQQRVMKEAIDQAVLHLQGCGYKTNKQVQEQLIAAITPKGSEQ